MHSCIFAGSRFAQFNREAATIVRGVKPKCARGRISYFLMMPRAAASIGVFNVFPRRPHLSRWNCPIVHTDHGNMIYYYSRSGLARKKITFINISINLLLYLVEKGCQTYDPRVASGPPDDFIRLAKQLGVVWKMLVLSINFKHMMRFLVRNTFIK